MKRAGVGFLGVAAALGMLGGGAVALRPFIFRETVTKVLIDGALGGPLESRAVPES